MGLHLLVSGLSDTGRIRDRNEDSLVLDTALGVAIVADGMGGHPGGDVASRVASEAAAEHLRGALADVGDPAPENLEERLGRAMATAVLRAHAAVRERAAGEEGLEGMGSTLTAILVHGSGVYAIGHAGDSRAYLLREGRLEQLTRDDTWVQERVEAEELTREQARRHPFGHMLVQCVGLDQPPEPQVCTGVAMADDAYLVCTDGLTGMLDDEEVRSALVEALDGGAGGPDTAAAARRLVDAAVGAGGHDNVTVAVIAAV